MTTPANTEFRSGPLAVLLTGTFLITLDFFIVNVALPSIQHDLGAADTALEWLVAGYGLTFGGLLLVASRLADRIGRRRMFCLGIATFVATSAVCGLAPDTETLVVARLAQGAGAAAIGPTVLALIGDLYAGPQRVRAIGTYATVMGVAAASGQLIGGLLIHTDLFGLGWRSVFLVNVPVGLAALVAAPRLLPVARVAGAPRLDVLEAALIVGALTAVVLPLVEGQRQSWPAWTWVCLGGSVGLAAAALLRGAALRRHGIPPLVDLVPLRPRPVHVGLLGQAALFMGMASYFLVLALYLQDGRGLGPLASGGIFTVLALTYMLGAGNAARCVAAYGARAALVSAALVFGAGHLALVAAVTWSGPDGSVLWLVPGLGISGLGMGVALSALVGTVMALVGPRDAGTVSGMSSTVQQIGNSVGVALVGLVFFDRIDRGVATAFDASLLYLVATTVAVAALAAFLPGRRPAVAVSVSAPESSASAASAS